MKKEEAKIGLTGLDQLMKKVAIEDIVKEELTMKELLYDQLPIKADYCTPVLPLFIYTVQPDKTTGTLNLEILLSSL